MSRRNTYFIPVAFTPANLTNLRLWCRSDFGVTLTGGAVSQWSDKSGNNNHLLQGTASKRPTVVSADLNGYDSILFDGTDDSMTASFTLNQPETIFIIFKAPTRTVDDYVFDGITANKGALEYYPNSSQYLIYAGIVGSSTPSNQLPANTYGLITSIFNGASSKLQINNNAQVASNVGTNNMGGLTLGGVGGGGALYYANISVVEIIVMASEATSTERSNIRTYVNSRYGITM